ncbi:hypothetical protein ElyMa_006845100 [Elysia marginata]|uniref:SCAN box domain-containing protein n=1 Tax=Elysia marginata TaxID=1093978 RepID=A0AAV4JCK8_9GAST|nr:hypothetical protein ElyMa_006845100 [Elysia marginata]
MRDLSLKKEEAERAAKKEEAERAARKELECAARKEELDAEHAAKMELEKMRLETDENVTGENSGWIVKEETVANASRFNDASAKHPKLPHFQDGKDDLDIWLTRFERFAESNSWSRDKWSSSLCALLTRRALDCYGRLSSEKAQDYDKVKQALMKRYDLTEDDYRRKFRSCKPAEGESPDMFIVRILTYLDRWIALSRTEKSYEKLKDLIVQEQFMGERPAYT